MRGAQAAQQALAVRTDLGHDPCAGRVLAFETRQAVTPVAPPDAPNGNVTASPVSREIRLSQSTSRSHASRSGPAAPGRMVVNTASGEPARRARTRATISSSAAYVPGTSRPSTALCSSNRFTDTPTAPAATPSVTSSAMRAMSSAVAGSFAAPRSPITNARTAPWGICAATSTARGMRSRASRYSGTLSQSHVIASRSDAPGMPSTPSMRPINQSCRSGAAGANPTPQLPITTVVTPCQIDGVSSGSHVTWPS